MLGAGEGGGNDETGVGVEGQGQGGEGEGEKKEEKHDVHKPAVITASMRETLRVKLGSLVHRKLSAILPDIFTLAGDSPCSCDLYYPFETLDTLSP